ncbi:MAG TPA: hypothetical protein VM324_07025, partial [Egibacteraceae bacterium]|nr:hypothetical protein [Egibacteraceae bacterium]
MTERRALAGVLLVVLAAGGWLALSLLGDRGQDDVDPIDLRSTPAETTPPAGEPDEPEGTDGGGAGDGPRTDEGPAPAPERGDAS